VAVPYGFAICNELFQKLPFAETCETVRALGYAGLEVAPFTLGPNAAALTHQERRDLHCAIRDAGISFVGLHWLLAGPPGLHATTPDDAVRRRTWDYLHALIDLCSDLTDQSTEKDVVADREVVMVFGSPKQRSAIDGASAYDAVQILTEELAAAAPHAESQGVKILLEPLSPDQTNVVTTLAEAAAIVKEIRSPSIQTMFDVHNAARETQTHSRLLRDFAPFIHHVHVNERDGREPGTGTYNFGELLSTLADLKYSGWVSLEVFDFSRGPIEIARDALHYLSAALPSSALPQSI